MSSCTNNEFVIFILSTFKRESMNTGVEIKVLIKINISKTGTESLSSGDTSLLFFT